MPNLIATLRALFFAALIRALTERLPQPPIPRRMIMENIEPGLLNRWRALPSAGMDASRLLVIGDRARVISPGLLGHYDRLVDTEHHGTTEDWPRWWEWPGGMEEPKR